MADKKSSTSSKKKKYPKMTEGVVHVKTSHNNTIVCFTDAKGNVIFGGGTGQA
jgi:small subunit ribosomal protein S11